MDEIDSPPASPLWTPDRSVKTRLHAFIEFVHENTGKHYPDYAALHEWSIKDSEAFWSSVWDFCDVLGDKGPKIIEHTPDVPWARFFPDSKINYTENILRFTEDKANAPAIIARTQNSADLILSWKELYAHVAVWESAMRHAGIEKGDYVAAYLPNIPETVIVFLAAAAIGATFVSAGTEMGTEDLISRFSQVNPKLLITTDGYIHGEKKINRMDVICKVHSQIPSIKQTVILSLVNEADERFAKLDNIVPVDDFLVDLKTHEITFERHAFNHPLYVLFSSGTTGAPKCFEHSTGGVLLKHLCELQLNSDVYQDDCLFYHATPSWMMWNWLVSALACGATILLYDGSPAYPDGYAQWDFTTAHGCTHHGTAAPLILSWAQADVKPAERYDYDLSPLRVIMSTGAVLPDDGFTYIHKHVKNDVKISSIAGGTDIVGCFIGGNPMADTYAGQINGPMLGMDVQVWNDEGASINNYEAGELVCTNAFPSMPLRFLNDADGERYRDAYFNYYPGRKAWRHGDSLRKTPEGQFVLIGRSDATLNQNGVRIGAVTIYKQLRQFSDDIIDYAAVDFTRPDNKQSITVLFLVMADGSDKVPEALQKAIKSAVKENVTPYAIPTEIIAVPGVLKTPNGKKAEVVTKKVLAGKEIPNPTLYGEDLIAIYADIGAHLSTKYQKKSA